MILLWISWQRHNSVCLIDWSENTRALVLLVDWKHSANRGNVVKAFIRRVITRSRSQISKTREFVIRCVQIVLKSDRRLGSRAAEPSVRLQSDQRTANPNLVDSRYRDTDKDMNLRVIRSTVQIYICTDIYMYIYIYTYMRGLSDWFTDAKTKWLTLHRRHFNSIFFKEANTQWLTFRRRHF